MNIFRFLVLLGVVAPHLVLLARIPSLLSRRTRKAFIMEYFENCDGRILPLKYENFTLVRNGSILHISGEEIVNRDLKNPISLHFHIERCKDKANLDTCEHFTTLKWDDYCTAITIVPVLNTISKTRVPPPACPMKKNHYHVKDAKVPLDLIDTFFANGSGGTRSMMNIRIITLEGSHMIGCIHTGLRVADVRIRS